MQRTTPASRYLRAALTAVSFGLVQIAHASAPCLSLPAPPNNEADGFVITTWGPSPVTQTNYGDGAGPFFSLFHVDIAKSPVPPIPPGSYAAWCFDSTTTLDPGTAGTTYGGYMFATCGDPTVFNAFLPDHPKVKQGPDTWKKINYLINHRQNACGGLKPTMWEVQLAIYTIFGQPLPLTPPYPKYRPAVVTCLVNDATANAPGWEPGCTDKVAVIFNIDINWDNVAPEVQLLFLEVPNSAGPRANPVTSCTPTVTLDTSVFTTGCGNTSIASAMFYVDSTSFGPGTPHTFPFGTTPVVYIVTDSNGFTTSGTFNVTVVDNEPPVLGPTPDVTANAGPGKCTSTVNFTVSATDCNLASVVCTPPSGSEFPLGSTPVTVVATDTQGHSSTAQFHVIVNDITPPVLMCEDVTAVAAPGTCSGTVDFKVTATDCSNVTLSYYLTYKNGTFSDQITPAYAFNGGKTTVWVKAIDTSNNVSVCSFTVTIKDTEKPVITSPLANINLQLDQGVCSATFTYTPSARDNCDGLLPASSMSVTPASGTKLASGTTTTVTVTATDSSGNTSTASFTVTVPVCPPPGLKLEKTASCTTAAPFQQVTYSYKVTNTGWTALTNILVKDDNGTPTYAADDFVVGTIASLAPGASTTLTAKVIPVVCFGTVVNGNTYGCGKAIVVCQPNGDIKVTYLHDSSVTDNTYGSGQVGWSFGRWFSRLLGNDALEFRFTDASGKVVLDFSMDYLSGTSGVTNPATGQLTRYASGFGSMGPFGGDGQMIAGSANAIVAFSTSLSDNLNNPANLPYKAILAVDSPTLQAAGTIVTNTAIAPGGWDTTSSYTVVVKGSTFGSSGFGSVCFPKSDTWRTKWGCEQYYPKPICCSVTNKATATAGSLTATATATVTICKTTPPPPNTGCIGSLVWIDKDGDGKQDCGEPGLPGVTVQLKNSAGVVIATDVTDGSGVYGFDGLAAGTYTVVVATPAGYTPSPKLVGTDRSIDSNGSPATVTLATNSTCDKTIDFGFVPSTICSKSLLTYTQGGWGSEPNGNNPGALLSKKFSSVYRLGFVTIGSGWRTLSFTSAAAVAAFLPQGGTPGCLSTLSVNSKTSSAGVLAGQLLALRLNVDFSNAGQTAPGLGSKRVTRGPFAGQTVNDVLSTANAVISGGSLPWGVSLSALNDALTAINENYDNGTANDGYLM